jgi:hypothetical protein
MDSKEALLRLQKCEKTLNDNKVSQATLSGQIESLKQDYDKLIIDIEAQGSKESDLGQSLTNSSMEILEKLEALEEALGIK